MSLVSLTHIATFIFILTAFHADAAVIPKSYSVRGEDHVTITANVIPVSRRASSQRGLYRKGYGATTVTSLDFGLELATILNFGNKDFEVIVDTGSSDTWIAASNFQCLDIFSDPLPRDLCGFGPTFDKNRSSFEEIPNENFNIQYGDGSALVGIVGYEKLSIAGITLSKQEIAVVEDAIYSGDGVTSGLMGLSYPTLTSAFNGTDPNGDFGNTGRLQYAPIITSMIQQGSISPVFSLAIERGPVNASAGVIAFGGIPHIHVESPYVSTPIQMTSIDFFGTNITTPTYQFYSIYPDAFVYGPPSKSDHTAPNVTSYNSSQILHIVDSGTSLNLLPGDLADAVAAQFNPPAVYDPTTGTYVVPCNAEAPYFGVQISGQILYLNPKDMTYELGGVCKSTIANAGPAGEGTFILGDPFFRNVVAVFDIGAEVMRFASRQNY
ncbi:hypothetical protein G7Y89_g2651 [Cudoniella acicularis]|uniref:Peptidase A1 domain-containing protein n=1 Tax=Cudoniella acicularis TaxID=354080 RepID=A0A8H4RUZ3_9HELO|nr:hypothetical protein G7Y89_g2651 [Cudoniella acicularis]